MYIDRQTIIDAYIAAATKAAEQYNVDHPEDIMIAMTSAIEYSEFALSSIYSSKKTA